MILHCGRREGSGEEAGEVRQTSVCRCPADMTYCQDSDKLKFVGHRYGAGPAMKITGLPFSRFFGSEVDLAICAGAGRRRMADVRREALAFG